jgi:hypothetical protein
MNQAVHSLPGQTTALATLEELRAPEPSQPQAKNPQAVEIARYRVIVEVALHDRPEPLARVGHRLVPPPAKDRSAGSPLTPRPHAGGVVYLKCA